MTDTLSKAADEFFGIKADPDDICKLQSYIKKTYKIENPSIIKKVFSSGEAADLLTVNETYFFREPAHFTLLGSLLPSYEKTGLRICSAASSCGCEAYSIAMFIEAYKKGLEKSLPYHIDAFDINPKMIESACQGIFTERSLREDGNCFRYMAEPFLKKLPCQPGEPIRYQTDLSLRKKINFFVHNLMNELPHVSYDIIFFRNAFIYFTPPNREKVISNLVSALNAGGILILGVSETAGVLHPGLEGICQNDVFYFKRK